MSSRRDAFLVARERGWLELDDLVVAAGRRPDRLGAADLLRLGAAYRATTSDLALARQQFPGDPIVERLEGLVGRARPLVYDAGPTGRSVTEFARATYWQRVAERPRLLLLAALLLLGPMLAATAWAWVDPGTAIAVAPSELGAVTEPRPTGADLGLAVDEQAAISSTIFTNNIRVAIVAFAGGILFGAGTVFILVFNRLVVGVVVGLAIAAGNGRALAELVLAHGVLELSCVVVAGAAGLRIGAALVDPGRATRGAALRREARAAVEMLLGTAAWLVVAGLVEGFVTPAGLGLGVVLVVGLALGATFWALVFRLGVAARSDSAA